MTGECPLAEGYGIFWRHPASLSRKFPQPARRSILALSSQQETHRQPHALLLRRPPARQSQVRHPDPGRLHSQMLSLTRRYRPQPLPHSPIPPQPTRNFDQLMTQPTRNLDQLMTQPARNLDQLMTQPLPLLRFPHHMHPLTLTTRPRSPPRSPMRTHCPEPSALPWLRRILQSPMPPPHARRQLSPSPHGHCQSQMECPTRHCQVRCPQSMPQCAQAVRAFHPNLSPGGN